jgi:hypothetical protein
MRPWTVLNPVFHFGVISRACLIRGAGFAELWHNLLALLIFALALMSLSFLASGFTWKVIYPVFLIGFGYFRFIGKERLARKEGKEVSAYS